MDLPVSLISRAIRIDVACVKVLPFCDIVGVHELVVSKHRHYHIFNVEGRNSRERAVRQFHGGMCGSHVLGFEVCFYTL